MQLALCNYNDQDLHVDIKFDSTMSILQKSVDLAGTQDPETLEIEPPGFSGECFS